MPPPRPDFRDELKTFFGGDRFSLLLVRPGRYIAAAASCSMRSFSLRLQQWSSVCISASPTLDTVHWLSQAAPPGPSVQRAHTRARPFGRVVLKRAAARPEGDPGQAARGSRALVLPRLLRSPCTLCTRARCAGAGGSSRTRTGSSRSRFGRPGPPHAGSRAPRAGTPGPWVGAPGGRRAASPAASAALPCRSCDALTKGVVKSLKS